MDGFQTSCPGQRVTDTVFTDLTQHLALPVTYAPDRDGNLCAALAAKDRPISDSRPLVQKVVQLLNATNTTYL